MGRFKKLMEDIINNEQKYIDSMKKTIEKRINQQKKKTPKKDK